MTGRGGRGGQGGGSAFHLPALWSSEGALWLRCQSPHPKGPKAGQAPGASRVPGSGSP